MAKKISSKKTAKKSAKKPVKKTAKKAVKKTVKKAAKKKTLKKAMSKASSKKVSKQNQKTRPVKKAQKVLSQPAKSSAKVDYSKAVTPLGERLVVKLLQEEQVTAGGIIIPSSVKAQTGYLKAKVLAIGSGVKTKKGHLKPLDVQVGDTVLFQGYASVKIEFKSMSGIEELHIVNESDVLGVV